MMQTMRRPQLLPCGHIGDKSSLLKFAHCRCDSYANIWFLTLQASIDIPSFLTSSYLLSLHFHIFVKVSYFLHFFPHNLDNETEKWTVHIVDFERNPLDAKTYYHAPCGHFFNLATIVAKHPQISTSEEVDNSLLVCSIPWSISKLY